MSTTTADLFADSAKPESARPATGLTEPLAVHFDHVPLAWRGVTEPFRHSEAGRALIEWVDGSVRAGATVYPREPLRALSLTPFDAVRVVILGQDPYHGAGQAEGIAFSVPYAARRGHPWPPSLRNILQEWASDLGHEAPASGSLVPWAQQGVLLLNTSLTVEDGAPASHAKRGWEALTDAIVDALAADPRPKVFLLWGAHAQAKAPRIAAHPQHAVLQSNHPSPLSAKRGPVPFVGSRPFSRAAQWLQQHDPSGPLLAWRL
ncbi:uracil-DNA glycosylase [Aquabacterium sp.]|uniref:uracil-DNA glycosylase n=1 Tax=Aquabacterium sp. TaxID=1872578 RepID=UPI0035B318CB